MYTDKHCSQLCTVVITPKEYIPHNTVLHSCNCLSPIFFTKMSMDHRFDLTATSLNAWYIQMCSLLMISIRITFSRYQEGRNWRESNISTKAKLGQYTSTISIHMMDELHVDFHVVSAAENFVAHRTLSVASMQTTVHGQRACMLESLPTHLANKWKPQLSLFRSNSWWWTQFCHPITLPQPMR